MLRKYLGIRNIYICKISKKWIQLYNVKWELGIVVWSPGIVICLFLNAYFLIVVTKNNYWKAITSNDVYYNHA